MKVRCIENFDVSHMFWTVSFQKGKEYSVVEIDGDKYIGIGLFNVDYDKVKNRFVDI